MIRLKRVILALLGATMTITLSAAPVTREQAKKNAVDFLKNVKGSRTLAPVQNRQKLGPRRAKATSTDTDLYYVFNRGNNEGYVIVSGDDQTLPIIGYTEEGEFDDDKMESGSTFQRRMPHVLHARALGYGLCGNGNGSSAVLPACEIRN